MHLVLSQGVASLGAALASFGIDVWFYKETGSYSNFAVIAILATLPPIIISPIAGFLVDRKNKTSILWWSEFATVVLSVLLALSCLAGVLNFSVISGSVFLIAVAGEFRYTAMMALIPEVTSREELSSISGVQQAFRGIVAVAGPLLGAAGYEYFGLLPLLFTSAIAGTFATLVAYRLNSRTRRSDSPQRFTFGGFIDDYAGGFQWLRRQTKLTVILVHFTFLFGLLAIFRTVLVPHVLDTMGERWLGSIVSAQGAGVLLAGLVLARVGKSIRSEVMLIVGCCSLGGAIIFFGLVEDSMVLVAISVVIGASISMVSAANQTIWHARTPQQIQGKIVAVRSMLLYLFSPFAIYLSVPVTDVLKNAKDRNFLDLLPPDMTPRWSGSILVLVGGLIIAATLLARMTWGRKSEGSSTCSEELAP